MILLFFFIIIYLITIATNASIIIVITIMSWKLHTDLSRTVYHLLTEGRTVYRIIRLHTAYNGPYVVIRWFSQKHRMSYVVCWAVPNHYPFLYLCFCLCLRVFVPPKNKKIRMVVFDLGGWKRSWTACLWYLWFENSTSRST